MARALRERNPCYAGATYALNGIISRSLATRTEETKAPRLYLNIFGDSCLSRRDPSWGNLEKADATGFRGIVSTACVRAFCNAASFQEGGFAPRIQGRHEAQDSALVCFESEGRGKQGAFHGALMMNSFCGVFPPNTLFKLKETLGPPFARELRGLDPQVHARGFEGNYWCNCWCMRFLARSDAYRSKGLGPVLNNFMKPAGTRQLKQEKPQGCYPE